MRWLALNMENRLVNATWHTDSAVQACIPFRAYISLHKGCEPMSDLSICARNLNAACGVSVTGWKAGYSLLGM